jgi:hypothetical protein
MRKISKSLLFGLSAILIISYGCGGDRAGSIESNSISIVSNSLDVDNSTIITDKDRANVEVIGELGSKVYLNNQFVGEIPESGKLVIDLVVVDKNEEYFYIHSVNRQGIKSKVKKIKVIKKPKSANLGRVETKGEPTSVTASNSTLFIAEQGAGVEIVGIGFDDEVSSDLIAHIDGIEANRVIISKDQKTLYIQNSSDEFIAYDISDLGNPKEIGQINPTLEIGVVKSADESTKYRVSPCGIIAERITNDSPKRVFLIDDKDAKDIVLTKDEDYLLVADGLNGLSLYDISGKSELIAKKEFENPVNSLSKYSDDSGLEVLFVANGKRVDIFNLEILLDEMLSN